MPQFILDHGSPEGAATFHALDSFAQGYVEAMFWLASDESDQDESGNPNQDPDWSVDMLAPESLAKIIADCASFMNTDAWRALGVDQLYGKPPADLPDDIQAGRDFWLTRNRHGAGFWDGDWPGPFGAALTAAAHSYGETDLYLGDDGRLYLS